MRYALLFGLVAVVLCPGCQTDYGQATNPYPVAAAEYDRLFIAAQDVLRQRGFAIDTANHRFGLVKTKPRSARTAFEPIRNNNATLRRDTQATLRHMRRTVTVSLEPAKPNAESDDGAAQPTSPPAPDDVAAAGEPPRLATKRPPGDDYQLQVHVRLQAKQQPTRRLIGGTGRRVFSNLDRVPQRWQQRGIESTYWQDVGRDQALENRLIHDIVRRSIRVVPSQRPFTGDADGSN